MYCKKCGSENVNVQAVTHVTNKKAGCLYWIFIGWWLEIIMWVIFTLPWLIVKIFRPKKIKSKTHSQGICQDCGYTWKV